MTSPKDILYPGLKDAIANSECFICKEKVDAFKDAVSAHEYTISGMCQECQDSFFCEDVV